MEKKVRAHINKIFSGYEQNEQTLETKEELITNLLDKITDLIKDGFSGEDAFNKAIGNLGSPKEIPRIFNFKKISEIDINFNLAGLFLLLALIVYLVLGFVFTLWHPGWIVFPISFMVVANVEKKYGAIWLIAIALYIFFGVLFEYWILGLSVFGFAAALVAGRDQFIAGLWLSIIAIYIVLGVGFSYWHPGWVIFLFGIALTALIAEKSITGFIWVFAIASYLFIGFEFSLWHPYWVIFVVVAAITVYIESGREHKEIEE
ncbi:permease prefix domain 1-containing protein [Candidatus Izimaplasma bacterium]|nr:permease prefix domain 1-containing protein [Candidatus Izimaplasma bacterium]